MSFFTTVQNYFTTSFTKDFQYFFFFYFAWITAHHISPHLYIYFCTPNTVWGIVASPFMATAPHCTGLRWVIYQGGNTINTMWISFAAYATSKMMLRKTSMVTGSTKTT